MITLGIKILPKKELLDVQGRAIADTLKNQGQPVEACQYGKFVRLTIQTDNQELALSQAKEIAESVLCNSLVETYEIEIL